MYRLVSLSSDDPTTSTLTTYSDLKIRTEDPTAWAQWAVDLVGATHQMKEQSADIACLAQGDPQSSSHSGSGAVYYGYY